MESRKVQSTGGSSFVITLPKEWIKARGIKKNDTLAVATQPDGSLLILPKAPIGQPELKKEFFVDTVSDEIHLYRLLIGAYIAGYSTINIKSKKRIEPSFRARIIKFTQTAIGPEIIEETDTSIITRDLLNPAEMLFDKTLNRMFILAKTMHEDVITALKNEDLSLVEDVVKRDDNVDRLIWLVSRQYNIVLRDVTLARKMDVSQEEATFYLLVARVIERIADHAVRIAKNTVPLIDKKVDVKIIDMIESASAKSLDILKRSIDAWMKRDMGAANQNLESVKNLIALCEEITNNALTIKGASSIPIGYIAESIRRVGEYGGDIAELVINYLIRE